MKSTCMRFYPDQKEKLLQACEVLFGSHLAISAPFLEYIQLSGVKSAYRDRVKETHPDVIAHNITSLPTDIDFLLVRDSYEQLCHFLDQRGVSSRPGPNSRLNPKAGRTTHARQRPQPSQDREYFSLPARRMILGEFLHSLGYCAWSEITQALIWQRRSRPRFGEIACNFGWIEKQDILTIFQSLQTGSRFGETAVRLGLLTPHQVKRLLRHQQIRQPKIGQFFLQNNLLSPEQLRDALWQLSKHNFLARQD
jgi:hypothetical protein